jgi:eukaryotic-like serine/threonine-protein kinase
VNAAVPEMLDLIVAKMLAKPLEERYQDAAELARDVRECERHIAAASATAQPATSTGTLPLAPEPKLVDPASQTSVLAQSVNRTREADRATEETPAPPARGLATSFDSMEATQRLASLTGATTPPPQTATQAIKSMPRNPPARWRRRDWLVFAGAGVCGLLVAGAILRRRP